MHTHMYTHTHTHMYTRTHVHTHACTHARMYTRTCTHAHTREAIKPGLDSGLDFGLDELSCVNNLFAARITELACASVASHIVLGIVCRVREWARASQKLEQRFIVSATIEV